MSEKTMNVYIDHSKLKFVVIKIRFTTCWPICASSTCPHLCKHHVQLYFLSYFHQPSKTGIFSRAFQLSRSAFHVSTETLLVF